MAAIRGIENAIACIRNGGAPYWKLHENSAKRTSGGFIAQSSYEADLSMDESTAQLYTALNRLTPGNYLLSSHKHGIPNKHVVDIHVEIGYSEINKPVAGIGSTFSIEGFGAVTTDNFEAALDKKLNDFMAKQKAEAELTALKNRVKELEAEQKENEFGVKRGIASLGTILYPIVKKMPAFKEVVSGLGQIMNEAKTLNDNNETNDNNAVEISGVGDDAEDRIGAAVETLAKGNPNIVKELELLAKLRQKDPSLYKDGVDFAESMAGEEN